MKLEKEFKNLDKKLRTAKEFQLKPKVNIIYGNRIQSEVSKMKLEENAKENMVEKLGFLTYLLRMIHEGATGFDLAYEVEKKQEVKRLIYDGIFFYNTFLEIGTTKFIDAPDKKIETYKSFRTVEDTEKYIFMLWLDDTITSLKEELYPKEDYAKYLKSKKGIEINKIKERLKETLSHCKNCGARIRSIEQKFCEQCGVNLSD